jgi:hypothetical protein
MAQQTGTGGLIAVDGSRGADIAKAADVLAKRLREHGLDCAISRWDASGLFGELAQGDADGGLSPRTLTLLYAADLAFRLRWEIRPAIAAGRVVIAAGYVETAAAFGIACGLTDNWLRHVFRLAPAPDALCRARERKRAKGWKPRLDRGYAEYAAALLDAATKRGFPSKSVRRRTMEALATHIRPNVRGGARRAPRPHPTAHTTRGGGSGRPVIDLGETGASDAARLLAGTFPTGIRKAASVRPPSTPRTARR